MAVKQDFTASLLLVCAFRGGEEKLLEVAIQTRNQSHECGDLRSANQGTIEADLGGKVPATETKQQCFTCPGAAVGKEGAFVNPNQGELWVTINPA